MGRRCTSCGGLMVSYEEWQHKRQPQMSDGPSLSSSMPFTSHRVSRSVDGPQVAMPQGVPSLTLYNPSLDIRMLGVNGAVIGRRQGPYQQLFEKNMYISGVHAQLIYKPDSGWCIMDKHSSNGTKLNQRDLLPDVPMSIKSGDIVTLANISLQVSIT
jgi:pSer/pThr/pTyr-binding forkhead associated (FHA) protein